MSAAPAAAESARCSIMLCERPGTATLDGVNFCSAHYIVTCFGRLRRYAELQQRGRLSEIGTESVRQFLRECVRQADRMEHSRDGDLSSEERVQLLDIILWATELARHLRRSSRRVVRTPLRLAVETPGPPWEVDAETCLVSRHGAMLELKQPLPANETLLVSCLQTGRQARARVAWYQEKENGRIEIGIEFLDSQNFWQLDWDSA